uniref:Uncharacterized protein n=1 Tax=Romanomermis culicivorax TaxID=13658 RepID=A0A915KVV1_ROMCU
MFRRADRNSPYLLSQNLNYNSLISDELFYNHCLTLSHYYLQEFQGKKRTYAVLPIGRCLN